MHPLTQIVSLQHEILAGPAGMGMVFLILLDLEVGNL